MTRLVLWLCLLCCLPVSLVGAQAQTDSAREQIIKRTAVPSVEQPQGEVQVLKRDGQLVVRTLLASRVLKRVAAAIDDKERRNWPENREGYTGSLRYREELFRATEVSWEVFRQRADQNDVRQYLAIEFILTAGKAEIDLYWPGIEGAYGQMTVVGRKPIKRWRSPEYYVRNNMMEIVMDSFHLDVTAADDLFKPLWP